MKNILTIVLISTITLIMSSGCKNDAVPAPALVTQKAPEVRDAKVSKEALYIGTHDNKKVINAIKNAGKKIGWKITEFKSNEVIAEKTDGESTVSSSIKFTDGYVDFSNNDTTSNLRDAIEEELSKSSSSH